MSAPDLASPIRDFFQTGGPYWLGGAHLAVIYSPGEVAIRMNIWEFFTPMNHLKQLLSVRMICQPYWNPYRESVKNFEEMIVTCTSINTD